VQPKEEYDALLRMMCQPGGVPPERIDAAETELGVIFPAPYRQFLAAHGAAVGYGVNVAGLFDSDAMKEPPMWTDVVRTTKRLRTVSASALAAGLVFLSDDGMDMKYYLDTRLGGQGIVVAFGPGVDGRIVAQSFLDFLVRAVKLELIDE
jgi:cell wall assembly regulator SMI1